MRIDSKLFIVGLGLVMGGMAQEKGAHAEDAKEAAATPAQTVNVFPQGDFEKTENGHTPANWEFPISSETATALKLDAAGVKAAKLSISPPGQKVVWAEEKIDGKTNHYVVIDNRTIQGHAIRSEIALDPSWKRIKISARLRAKNLKKGALDYMNAYVAAFFNDAQGAQVKAPLSASLSYDSDWTEKSALLDVPAGATHVVIAPWLWSATGEMAVDDIRIEPNPPVEAATIKTGSEDGMFEELEPDGYPDGWKVFDKRYTTIVEENGNHFMRVSSPTLAYQWAEKRYKIDPAWKEITIGATFRIKDLKPGEDSEYRGARLYPYYLDAEGNKTKGWAPTHLFRTDTDWTEVARTSPIPEGSAYIVLQVGLAGSSGTLDVDNIKLEPGPLAKE